MSIPQKLIDDFDQLRECLIILRRDYNTYNALYCEENRTLLTAIAPTFFTDIGEILQRDWILQVGKLMDPAVTKVRGNHRENLTIQLILQQLKNESLLTDAIHEKANAIFEYGEIIKPARDRICHFENITMSQTTDEKIFEFIENIQHFTDLVGNQIGVGPLDFSSSGCSGDVYDLLRCLRECEYTRKS